MNYASVGVLALILHLIINKEALKRRKNGSGSTAMILYRQFLYSVLGYYITDIIWGVLYEFRIIPLVYADTVLYFTFMVLTVVLWVRFVIEYLDEKNRFGGFLKGIGWATFLFTVLHLIINFFKPVLFVFENGEYRALLGRYTALTLQMVLYLLASIYTFYVASRSEGKVRIHNRAVGFTCISMEVLIVFQILYPLIPFYAMGCLIETCIIHAYIEQDERMDLEFERRENEIANKEKERYNLIASSLASDYEAIYYINIETGGYREFSTSTKYESMNVPMFGEDFYAETVDNVLRYVHPDDKEFALSLYSKDVMLKNLDDRNSYSYKYRIMVNGEPRYFMFTIMLAQDMKHFILCEKDIQDEVTAETIFMENQKHHATFGQIAESLASNYDEIYYVDIEDNSYVGYETNNLYGMLEVKQSGDDFFEESRINIPKVVLKSDRERLLGVLDKDHLLSTMENKKQYAVDYRLMVEGKSHYVRMSVRKSSDMSHFIIGVENIDNEVKKERAHLRALNTERELARRDELTGTKNKTAYAELEKSVQSNIENGMDYLPFGIVVCDVNGLKKINDEEGHKAGDEYLKASAKLLCDIFAHSPVFRIGGDEFVVFLRGDDYEARTKLMNDIRKKVRDNQANGSGPVIAVGMSEYDPETDDIVSDIFERADSIMYTDKQNLKNIK